MLFLGTWSVICWVHFSMFLEGRVATNADLILQGISSQTFSSENSQPWLGKAMKVPAL